MRRKAQAFGILAVFAAVMAFTGCANKKSDNVKRIGILQLVEHDALNDARKGFVDGLKEDGYVDGKNIEIQYKNAQNDQSNCQTIASSLSETGVILCWPLQHRRHRPWLRRRRIFRSWPRQ